MSNSRDKKKSKVVSIITPFLTWNCNRMGSKKCKNCWADWQGQTTGDMSEEIFQKFCDWTIDYINNNDFKTNAVLFLGGEPLLATDKIRRYMQNIKDKITDEVVTGNIFSNCDLIYDIDPKDLENIQILHFNIANTPIEEARKRIRYIKENLNLYHFRITATLFDSNLDRLEDIARLGIEEGLDLRLYKEMFEANNEAYKDKLIEKWHSTLDVLENEFINKGYHVEIPFLYDGFISNWIHETSPYSCGRGIVTIYPDGSIGNCIRNINKKAGTLDDPNPQELIKEDYMKWSWQNHTNLNEKCKSCDIRFACQGGCPQNRYYTYGTFYGEDPWCRVHKAIMPRVKSLGKEIEDKDGRNSTYKFRRKIGESRGIIEE